MSCMWEFASKWENNFSSVNVFLAVFYNFQAVIVDCLKEVACVVNGPFEHGIERQKFTIVPRKVIFHHHMSPAYSFEVIVAKST